MTERSSKDWGAGSAPNEPALAVRDIAVEFGRGRSVVHGVSFSIKAGETVAIVGESGSGKSVTSLAIMRLLPSHANVSGQACLSGESGATDVFTLGERDMRKLRGARIGMIFQEPMTSLNPLQRVQTQVVEAIRLHQRVSVAEARRIALQALTDVGIPEPAVRMKSYPYELSGGIRQRVMIAIALACSPDVLIADEPTTALDVTVQAQIVELLAELQEKRGMAMLFITHDLALVSNLADRILVMYAGRVVEAAPAAELFRKPLHPYTAGLLASTPRPGQTRADQRLQTIRSAETGGVAVLNGCPFAPRCDHAIGGVCDAAVPPEEKAGGEHTVRCFRWREIGADHATA